MSRAKGTSVDGVREAGVLESGGGKVRLLKWSEYEADWDPAKDNRTPIWEACHQMIRHLKHQGESGRRVNCSPGCRRKASPSVNSPIIFTPCASARNGPKTPAPITN